MTNVYTTKDWDRDGELNPQLFQEVEHSIYTEMFNILPPYTLDHVTQQILENQLGIKFVDTFCMGEAYDLEFNEGHQEAVSLLVNDKLAIIEKTDTQQDVFNFINIFK